MSLIKNDRNQAAQHAHSFLLTNGKLTLKGSGSISGGNSSAVAIANELSSKTFNVLRRYSVVLARTASQISIISENMITLDNKAAKQIGNK